MLLLLRQFLCWYAKSYSICITSYSNAAHKKRTDSFTPSTILTRNYTMKGGFFPKKMHRYTTVQIILYGSVSTLSKYWEKTWFLIYILIWKPTLCSLTIESHYCSPRVLWAAVCIQKFKLIFLQHLAVFVWIFYAIWSY